MFTTIARIITRLQGEGDGLMIGSLFNDDLAKSLIKPNSIYELQYCALSGDINLKYKGESLVAAEGQTVRDSPISVHWAMEYPQVLARGGNVAFWTKEEYEHWKKSQETED